MHTNMHKVVSKDSAGLNGKVAFSMPDVNHNEMCKFEHKFHPAYLILVERLDRLRCALLGQDDEGAEGGGSEPVVQSRAELV
jgi:hypothetical protein